MDRPYLVLDTETATLQGAPHLLELGAVRVEQGEVVDRFDELVRPQVPIEAEASAIHGIRDEEVRNAREAREVLADFARWAGTDLLVAHNARFDANVLAFEYRRCELEPPAGVFLCTLKLANRWLPDAPDHKLPTLCQWLDLEVEVHHRALPDAVSCWKVFEECVRRARENGAESSAQALLAQCGKPLSIASAAPRVPRLSPRLRPLEQACASRAQVTLCYGDDVSNALLPVSPRILFERYERGYLEAECLRSGLLKTYRLDKVRRVVVQG